MKTTLVICLLLCCGLSATAQYYLRGEVRDEKNNPLTNARIKLHSSGYLYYSGSSGTFGIMTSHARDTISISLEGYQPVLLEVDALRYQQVVLKMLFAQANVTKTKLVSITKNLQPHDRINWSLGGETYSSLLENEFVATSRFPETGFAMHTDKASYSNVRRFLNMNSPVPPDAVRTEEILNYFNFDYKAPPKDSVFGFHSVLTDCPWNPDSRLLYLQVNARKLDSAKIPQSNLVFLIDVSGSMDMPNRLPLLKSAFKLLLENLREKDTISIIVYGSTVGVWLQPTSGKEKELIRKSIEELYPGGSTPGESGIRSAYRLAKSQFIKGGNNRVIIATDGDFNVGQTSDEDLEKLITQHQQLGIYLTCLGVGMGNYKDSKLEVLAKKGNGNFAYLDNEAEAEKVLVKELTQTLYTVADDAYLDIQFNPELVRDYRLIGFDNKVKALADSSAEVEGGEVGSGHSLMAVFELRQPLEAMDSRFTEGKMLAEVEVQYKNPGDTSLQYTHYHCTARYSEFSSIDSSYRFASSLIMFSSLLRESKFMRRVTFSDVIELAKISCNPSDALQKEFIVLADKARKVYSKIRKKKSGRAE